MDNAIKFKIIYTKEHLISAAKSFYASQLNNQVIGALLLFVFLSGTFSLIRYGLDPGILLGVIMALIGLIYPYYINPIMAVNKSGLVENPAIERLYSITKDGISVGIDTSEAKIDWETFRDFIETRSFFFLVYSENKSAFQFIPKQVFETSQQVEDFRQLLKEVFASKKKSFIARHALLLLFIAALGLLITFMLSIARGTP